MFGVSGQNEKHTDMELLETHDPEMGHRHPESREVSVSVQEIADAVCRIAQVFHRHRDAENLRTTQWGALRFFNSAAEEECTVSAFALHTFTSRSSASQTVNALVRRGLLVRLPVPEDRRTHRLTPTNKARRLLASDPLKELEFFLEKLVDRDRAQLSAKLKQLLSIMLEWRDSNNYIDQEAD